MIKSFHEIVNKVKNNKMKTIAVAAAEDEQVLEAVKAAKEQSIADAILVGDEIKIIQMAKKIEMDISQFKIINEKDRNNTSITAVELVSSGQADMLMKGFVDTATFLKAVLDKQAGLRTGRLMSHVAVFEIPGYDRLILLTDAAFNINPDLKVKLELINNAVEVAKAVEIQIPRVAAICAVELVNPEMYATVDAAILSKMNERGQIKGCIVDGPLAIDNALSEEAAKHKNITGEVAGKADILLLPNIEAANSVYKTLTYTTCCQNGGIVMGTSAPVVLTSRADSFESKLYSIALAALVPTARQGE